MKTVLLTLGVVVLMTVSGGVGFYFGTDNGLKQAQNIRAEFFQQRTGSAQAQDTPSGDTTQPGQRTGGQGQVAALGGRPTANGAIKSVEGNKIAITQPDGSTVTVTVDDKTTIQKQVNGSVTDLQAGMRVIVTEQGGVKRIQIVPTQ